MQEGVDAKREEGVPRPLLSVLVFLRKKGKRHKNCFLQKKEKAGKRL